MKRILLIEDDETFGPMLKDFLELNEYEVELAVNGDDGLAKFADGNWDLCILDVMMPKRDGFSTAKEIRKATPNQPLIFLTAKSMKEDMLEGFRLGADDYLTKPFDTEVLLYKIKAVLNRQPGNSKAEGDKYSIGKYTFDPRLRILSLGDEERKLSPKESQLLELLARHKNDLLPRSVALVKIWKDENYFTGRSMDVYVAKLRKYLSEDGTIEIQNVHGEGFILAIS
ncbi:response regulator transcription factor [Phaeocystidibacter luteus]|uniref:Response regulator transcription factor n=1 Tax=Phaeocystidibacter luteus TaxID=911197 RepID=A0A6N6RIZ6_9FLAO|nr:response regulator transcription factor [Phaeocystidibacter luteus]KAB2814310.1 response regulator transcription factor [Phaeocystidibacter luteus]